jgi:hypothetical protein
MTTTKPAADQEVLLIGREDDQEPVNSEDQGRPFGMALLHAALDGDVLTLYDLLIEQTDDDVLGGLTQAIVILNSACHAACDHRGLDHRELSIKAAQHYGEGVLRLFVKFAAEAETEQQPAPDEL